MASSRRRYSLSVRNPLVILALLDAEQRFLNYHRANQHSEKTLRHYRQTFRNWHRYLEAVKLSPTTAALTTEHVRGFAVWIAETPIDAYRGTTQRSPHGIHGHLKDLRAFTTWLYREQLLAEPVAVPVPRQPQRFFRILTDEEQAALFSCRHLTAEGPQAKRNLALFLLFLDTGARLSELANATLDDLYLQALQLKVTGKGSQSRVVFYAPETARALKTWLTIRGDHPGPLFDLTHHGIVSLFRRIKRETGLAHLHPHALRHLAATKMLINGMDTHSVKRILGHRQLSTVEWYLSLSDADIQRKHAEASPVAQLRGMLQEQPKKRRLSLK